MSSSTPSTGPAAPDGEMGGGLADQRYANAPYRQSSLPTDPSANGTSDRWARPRSCGSGRRFQCLPILETSYCAHVVVAVDVLSEERLTEWLISADSSARAAAWSRLLEVLGGQASSRRWLASFAAFDAAETLGPLSSAADPFIRWPFLGGHFGPGAGWRHIVLGGTRGFDEERKRRERDEAQVANSRAGARRASS